MKKIFKILTVFTFTMLLVQSCSKDDKIIDEVFDGVTNGAILRVIDVVSGDVALGDANARFEILVEEQDNQNGALFQQIDMYADFQGGTKSFIKTIDASTFTTFADTGLPRGTVMATVNELATATGVDPSTLNGGDVFNIHLDLVLTDGRVFNADNTGANVAGGAFYNSPFLFASNVVCLVPDDYMVGNYTILRTSTQEDPFFPNYGQAFSSSNAQPVTIAAAGVDRVYEFSYFPDSFAFGQTMTLSFVCGEIQVLGTATAGTLGCGGGSIQQATAPTPTAYNLADDNVIDIDMLDFEPDAGCGTGNYPVTLRHTKQ